MYVWILHQKAALWGCSGQKFSVCLACVDGTVGVRWLCPKQNQIQVVLVEVGRCVWLGKGSRPGKEKNVKKAEEAQKKKKERAVLFFDCHYNHSL